MLRKVMAVLAAIAITTGLTMVVTSGADAKSVLPAHGNYAGVDHSGRMVTLSFSGNYMSHFTVGHKVIGGAHVSTGAWHETCHGGFCTKGMWVTDNHITGSWREGGGSWTHFSVYLEQPIKPYVGTYMGRDHSGLKVHLSFGSGKISAFTLDHSNRGNIPVTHGKFETCLPSICVKGHWQSEYEVVGSWRPANGSHWSTFDAYAYAF
ncbi:hypothetical protein GCM10023350_37930 [Nocardioides endophyticus]|uniref:Uncharacterized protein n=1 Tax=Nocardioides endophyticus TaxID=1353775 RepID=A0ABP8Z868_9ACTN